MTEEADNAEFTMEEQPPIIIQHGEDNWMILSNSGRDLMEAVGASCISIEGDNIFALMPRSDGKFEWIDIVGDYREGAIGNGNITRIK